MTRGAQGGETFMASRCPWDGYQAVCRFDRSAVGALGLCSFEECHPINRESIPPRRHFLSASPLSGFVSAPSSTMAAKKDVASSSAARLSRKGGSRQPCSGKPTNKLNKREFRKRFYFPNDISVQLVDGNPMSTEKAAHNAIYFTKEQFNASSVSSSVPLQGIPPLYLNSSSLYPSQYCASVDGVQTS
ncbi:hypothetical protein CK203_112295 [Vitis vinifera]|uniref:Uncharacterized protein n=1 Tax=Vitis vinifera TaxID=29760 RepID=A0A438CCK8_VITVI|nr:hypothetical protein CK203_112295 [Vitis vinifera]